MSVDDYRTIAREVTETWLLQMQTDNPQKVALCVETLANVLYGVAVVAESRERERIKFELERVLEEKL